MCHDILRFSLSTGILLDAAGINLEIRKISALPHPLQAFTRRLHSQRTSLRCISEGPAMRLRLLAVAIALLAAAPLFAGDGNRLAYLDGNDPYYPSRTFPKLTTPMWVG